METSRKNSMEKMNDLQEYNEEKISYIQRYYREYRLRRFVEPEIKKIIKKNKIDLNRSAPKTTIISEYEEEFGFTEDTRGGANNFSQTLGDIIPKIYGISLLYQNVLTQSSESPNYIGGCDGKNKDTLFECKNRYNTMKASQALSETQKKLEYAIENDKKFILLCLVDKHNGNNNLPLHKFNSLKKIENVDKYESENHRYLSGVKVWDYLFPYQGEQIKSLILKNLKEVSEIDKNKNKQNYDKFYELKNIFQKLSKKEIMEYLDDKIKEFQM